MKIDNNSNSVYFGQKIPTKPMLRLGSGIYNYEEAMSFCQLFDNKFPGHLGYYKKARNFIKQICDKNPKIKEIIYDITPLDKNEKLKEISKQVNLLGEEIDIEI